MSSKSAAASRVAVTIGVVKWIVIGAQVLFGVVLLLVLNAQQDWPTWTAAAGPLALVGCLLNAVLVWVLFGWFQHTLGMLAAIAANTAQAPPIRLAQGGPVSRGVRPDVAGM